MAPAQSLLQRFFEFYSAFFGITAPPPAKQKLFLGLLLMFFILLALMMFAMVKVVSSF